MIDHEQKFEELAEKCFNGDIYGFFLTSRDYTLYADQLLEIKTGSDGKKRYLFGKNSGDTDSPIWAYDWRGYSCLNHHNKGIISINLPVIVKPVSHISTVRVLFLLSLPSRIRVYAHMYIHTQAHRIMRTRTRILIFQFEESKNGKLLRIHAHTDFPQV